MASPPPPASRPPSRPPSSSASSSRPLPLPSLPTHRPISTTTPMTETDEDGPVRLPVARKPRLRTATPLDILFGVARFLSVVPAVCSAVCICLALTSGLLFRWRTYYPPLPTLVRLLALQAICWSATSMSSARCVAFIATCTSISRAVQMWVTSNLWRLETGPMPPALTRPSSLGNGGRKEARWRGGTWRGRRWDWGAVTRRCIVPLAI
ncbi:hypothetical protein BDZ89DRAFT_1056394 [Hymenopellis radicata]|nr:hypothetical protein BDZ89DRAFT_1056394 [Hymenopellis radicata]